MPARRFWQPCTVLLLAFGVAAVASGWSVRPKQSTLTFAGRQAGAAFEGVFERFSADLHFDPQDLSRSRFDVRIDLASVDSRDEERDEIIRGPDLFAVERWPGGRYVADRFTAIGGDRYTATGNLTLRNVTRAVPIEFTFRRDDAGAWIRGSATLRRLDFGVGQGEWQDTRWVGNEVQVRFNLLLTPQEGTRRDSR